MVKNSPANVGDPGLIPGSGRSPREGNDKPTPVSLEPGRIESMGSQRFRQDLTTKQQKLLFSDIGRGSQ